MATYDKEFIIRYAEDECTEEEKRQFEADLRIDASLAAELSLYREVKATLQQRLSPDLNGEALQSTLKDLNKTYFATPSIPPAKRIPLTRWVTGVAAACIIALSVYLLLPSRDGGTLDQLGHTEMVNTTERGSNTDSLLQQAAVFFNRQEFSKALPLLNRAVITDSSNQLALFYRGVAKWHTGVAEDARKDLEQIYNGESLLRYEAAFYIALSYAGEKNNTAAKEWLTKIPAGTPVSDKAKQLEKKLQ